MASPLSASRIVSLLRDEGLRVHEVRRWRHHNRNHNRAWGPVHGVMLHHTAAYSSESQIIRLCYEGRGDLPGPLALGVIDKQGTIHLIGHGRANHAGLGDDDVLRAVIREDPLPPKNELNTDGNRYFYGFEAINAGDGQDPWPSIQIDAMTRASAALLRGHGWGTQGATSVIGHNEWQEGKIDPSGKYFPGMDEIRRRVAERLTHHASW